MAKKCVRLKGSENAFLCVILDQNAQPVYVVSDPVGLSGLYPATVREEDEKRIISMVGDLFKIKHPENVFECIDFEEKNFIRKPKILNKNGLN